MKQAERQKKALAIADELQKLGYSEIAAKLREAVNLEKSKRDATTQEGAEGDGEDEGENGNHPPKKGGN